MGRERRRIRRTPEGGRAASTSRTSTSGRAGTPASIQVRSDRVIARETESMLSEMKRVTLVSAVCFGMLAILMIVDRLA